MSTTGEAASPTLSASPSSVETFLRVRASRRIAQRGFDIVLLIAGSIVVVPLMVVIAVMIKLDSPGPVFYRQTRIGLHREPFRIWKFRKMRDDLPAQGPMLTLRYDTRLTRVGRVLERTKLDELPQVINVVAGQMSIVGPRPEVPRFVHAYPELWDRVLSVPPGIFGASQNHFRNESELYPDDVDDLEQYYVDHILPEMLELDARYAEQASLRRDATLLFGGVFASLLGSVTSRGLVTRRAHLVRTGLAMAVGLGTVLLASDLVDNGSPPPYAPVVGCLAALIAMVLSQVPAALPTSLTAEDGRRLVFAAAIRSAMIVFVVMLVDQSDLGSALLVVDGALFIGGLVVLRLMSYLSNVNRVGPRSSSLRSRVTWYAAFIAPISIAAVVTASHGWSAWTGDEAPEFLAAVLLALVARPALLLLSRPAGRLNEAGAPLARELSSMIVSVITGSGLLLLVAGIGVSHGLDVSDVAIDGAVFGAALIGVGVWQAQRLGVLHRVEIPPERPRAIVVGDGPALASYLAAVDVMDHRDFDLVGVVTPRARQHGSAVSGHRVVGSTSGLAEVLATTPVEQIVVVVDSLEPTAISALQELAEQRRLTIITVSLTTQVATHPGGET